MQRKIWNYFEMAGKMAVSKKDRRTYRLGCVAIRNDGKIVKSCNGPTPIPDPYVHAEARISTKIDHGAIIFIARVRKDGSFGMAKPCKHCRKFLRSKQVKKIYYTTGPSSWEAMLHGDI